MRLLHWFALVCAGTSIPFHGQNPPASQLPKDPGEIFSLAAPAYDYSDASLKPWHLKATYQLYDEAGKPSTQGTYEYWWATPAVYRSTWMRGDSRHTDWHTSDGKHLYASAGPGLDYFEYSVQSNILTPLPEPADYDAASTYFDRKSVKFGAVSLPCFMIVPKMPQYGEISSLPLGMFPTYCFDPERPVLRLKTSFGSLTVSYDQIVRVQNRYLAKSIEEYEAGRKILSLTVDTLDALNPADPSLTPTPDAKTTSTTAVGVASGVMAGHRTGGPVPVYPQDAKAARAQGKVVLQALIGRDGKIHELKVISAPFPSLVESAMWAVSHWEYKPYLLNGDPVDVQTQINVIFSLGY